MQAPGRHLRRSPAIATQLTSLHIRQTEPVSSPGQATPRHAFGMRAFQPISRRRYCGMRQPKPIHYPMSIEFSWACRPMCG